MYNKKHCDVTGMDMTTTPETKDCIVNLQIPRPLQLNYGCTT